MFLEYSDSLGVDDIPPLAEFKKMYSDGNKAWDDLTLKMQWKDAISKGDIQPFTRFEEYKGAADYIVKYDPGLAASYGGNIEAAVNDVTNKVFETGKPVADVVEGLKNPDIDSDDVMGDNENNLIKDIQKYKTITELLGESTCTDNDLYNYLKNIDSVAAEEFLKSGKWPCGELIPKSTDVLNSDGTIKWNKAPKGGYKLDDSGNAIKEEYSSFVDEVIDRYGPPNGRYVCPVKGGNPYSYDMRSLPFIEDASQYHRYKVKGDLSRLKEYVENCTYVDLRVNIQEYINYWYNGDYSESITYKGVIADVKGFGKGGGIQYELPIPIEWLIKLGLLEVVY